MCKFSSGKYRKTAVKTRRTFTPQPQPRFWYGPEDLSQADTKEVTPAKSTFQTFFFGLSSANPNLSIVIRQIILKFRRGFKTTCSSYRQLGNFSLLWLSKHILNSPPSLGSELLASTQSRCKLKSAFKDSCKERLK